MMHMTKKRYVTRFKVFVLGKLAATWNISSNKLFNKHRVLFSSPLLHFGKCHILLYPKSHYH